MATLVAVCAMEIKLSLAISRELCCPLQPLAYATEWHPINALVTTVREAVLCAELLIRGHTKREWAQRWTAKLIYLRNLPISTGRTDRPLKGHRQHRVEATRATGNLFLAQRCQFLS